MSTSEDPLTFTRQAIRAFRAATGHTGPLSETAFGTDAATTDELAALIPEGVKTATSSLHAACLHSGEPLPGVGDHFVVIDSTSRATCIARTTDVRIRSYGEIDTAHAHAEGEGDRTLAAWHAAHEPFFPAACADLRDVEDDVDVICERFAVVWPPVTVNPPT